MHECALDSGEFSFAPTGLAGVCLVTQGLGPGLQSFAPPGLLSAPLVVHAVS